MDPSKIESLFGGYTPWPWQRRGVAQVVDRLENGIGEPVVVTGPTGSGKTLQMMALMRYLQSTGRRVVMYSNRKMLTSQTMDRMKNEGLSFGVRAAEFESYRDDSQPIQLSQSTTELHRTFVRRKRAQDANGWSDQEAQQKIKLFPADVAIIDEIHMNKGAVIEQIISEHVADGATIIGYTATPLGIDHLFDDLIIAGTVRECMKKDANGKRALVPAAVFGCAELDTRKIKRTATGEFNLNEVRKNIWTPSIFGYVWDEWKRLNPDGRQTIGFGPGVSESIWFAEQFHSPYSFYIEQMRKVKDWHIAMCEDIWKHGVSAAHIDGENCWVDGKQYASDRIARDEILKRWNGGEIKICWNRFVMREGIDAPSCAHLILATPVGSLLSYIQIAGRVLRYSSQTPDKVVIQDHGANFWRHGSPNVDRDWQALFHTPVKRITDLRLDAMQRGELQEPITCPFCKTVRKTGSKCPNCNQVTKKKTRFVIQEGGTLKQITGPRLRKKGTKLKSDTQEQWDKMYWAARRKNQKIAGEIRQLENEIKQAKPGTPEMREARAKLNELQPRISGQMTFKQLYEYFRVQHGYYPPDNLENMPNPKDRATWMEKVCLVDNSRIWTKTRDGQGNEVKQTKRQLKQRSLSNESELERDAERGGEVEPQ